jgi:hypothetical protein
MPGLKPELAQAKLSSVDTGGLTTPACRRWDHRRRWLPWRAPLSLADQTMNSNEQKGNRTRRDRGHGGPAAVRPTVLWRDSHSDVVEEELTRQNAQGPYPRNRDRLQRRCDGGGRPRRGCPRGCGQAFVTGSSGAAA